MSSTPARLERERELLQRWDAVKDTDSPERGAIREELITEHLPLVRHLARRYADRGEPLEDVVQVGTIGLMRAIDRFDSSRGYAFSSFATPTILGEIKRHFRDHSWSIHVPRPLKERGSDVRKATESLTTQLGRAPTIAEIADALGIDVPAVVEALDASHAYEAIPLQTPTGSFIVEPTSDDLEVFAAVENRATLMPLLRQLSEREQQIIQMRFGDNMRQTQIAESLGISQMHVSRLLSRSLATLRVGLQDAGDLRG